MTTPVRLQLSRRKGFNLQAWSREVNGLAAVKVSRPGRFGNPFTLEQAADVFDCRRESAHIHAVKWFRDWITAEGPFDAMGPWGDLTKQHAAIRARLPELRGKNLACFCRPEYACHADVLLELARGAQT